MFKQGNVPAHKGKTTTSDPVKTGAANALIKELLKDSPRDLALWTVAVQTMLRAGDLVSLQWSELLDDGECIEIRLLEEKTDKRRMIPLPAAVSEVLRVWRDECKSEFVFSGQRGQMTTHEWGRKVKKWCKAVGLEGSFSGHTTRKTGVRIRYDEHNVSLATLQSMLNHRDEIQTLTYMGRMTEDVAAAHAAVL